MYILEFFKNRPNFVPVISLFFSYMYTGLLSLAMGTSISVYLGTLADLVLREIYVARCFRWSLSSSSSSLSSLLRFIFVFVLVSLTSHQALHLFLMSAVIPLFILHPLYIICIIPQEAFWYNSIVWFSFFSSANVCSRDGPIPPSVLRLHSLHGSLTHKTSTSILHQTQPFYVCTSQFANLPLPFHVPRSTCIDKQQWRVCLHLIALLPSIETHQGFHYTRPGG